MKILFYFIFIALASISNIFASAQGFNKDEEKIILELTKQGYKIDKVSEIIFHNELKKKKIPNGSYYKISFICRHEEMADICKLSNLDISKETN